jgi:WD40 repeat protein
LWNPFSGKCVAELSGHEGNVTDVAVSPSSGYIVTTSDDRTARIAKLPPLEGNPRLEDLVIPSTAPAAAEKIVPVRPVRQWATGQRGLRSISVMPNGQRIATGGEDGVVRIWDTETGNLQRELTGPTDDVLCVLFSPNGRWLTAGGLDTQIYVWDMDEQSGPKSLDGHTGWVTSLAFSSTSELLLSGSLDANMRLWNVETGEAARPPFRGKIEWIRSVSLSRNRRGPVILSGGNAGCVRFWGDQKLPNGKVMGFFIPVEQPYQSGQISSLAVTPNGRLVAAAGWNRPVQVWNTMTGKPIARFGGDGPTIYDLAWYGDEQRLLTACADGTLRLWDRRNGQETTRLLGHSDAVRSLSMSDDLQTIASAGEDGMVCLWPAWQSDSDAQDVARAAADTDPPDGEPTTTAPPAEMTAETASSGEP